MVCRLVLAVIGLPLALATLLHDEDIAVCASKNCPERKSLLQSPKPHSMLMPQRARLACPLDISGVADAPGNTEPLNEAGFENVRACCCPAQMREFIRRLVQADTNVVCHEGGLGGLTLFYYCHDYPENDFDSLVAAIGSDSAAQTGACPWIGFGPDKDLCPPQNQNPTVCTSFPGVTEPPCSDCETSTTTTTTTATPAEIIDLTMRFDNMDYDAFANDTDLRNAFIEKVRDLTNSRLCPPCDPFTAEELAFKFSKGSVVVNISTILNSQKCTGGEVISEYANWSATTLEDDVVNVVKKVPNISSVTVGGNGVTGISGVTVKEVDTAKAEPCPHDFPWCNNGLYCERAWCRYYGGCKADSYRRSRSCSSQYVPKCTVPSTSGYDFSSVGGTTTISGFNPSGVACVAGYVGELSYTVCSSAETPYSVSGCQEISSISYTQKCTDCYCSGGRKHLDHAVTLSECKEACSGDPGCGYITYYGGSQNWNCYTCPLSGWTQEGSTSGGTIYTKKLTTSDWYGVAGSI